MDEKILSVRTDELIEQTWKLLTDDGENIDDVISIYNELCKCSHEIKKCECEKDYNSIESRIVTCENRIRNYA